MPSVALPKVGAKGEAREGNETLERPGQTIPHAQEATIARGPQLVGVCAPSLGAL